jgi:glycerophosphoryl diester phosphodiesterase
VTSAFARSGLVLGHRGVRPTGEGAIVPAENTLPAFARAAEAGADGIELDVRLAGDGEVVVFHDPTLARMTEGRDERAVAALSAAELAAVLLPGGGAVPTLAAVLSFAKERALAVNVELKHDGGEHHRLAERTARVVRASGADVLFSSFDPRLLIGTAVFAPRTPRAWLLHPTRRWSLPAAWALARSGALQALHPERTQVSERLVRAMKRRGLKVGVWTVNDEAEAGRFHAWGVDWVITDAPAALRAVVTPRS